MCERMYTIKEAAGKLGMSRGMLYKLIRRGYLKPSHVTTGRVWHVTLRQVRDAKRRWDKPDGWMTTREALDFLGVSDTALRHWVRRYGIPSRRCHARGWSALAYPTSDITWLKERWQKVLLARHKHVSSPPFPAVTPEALGREARMRRWLDEQEQDRREREQAEAERWALFPIRLAAQKQAIAEGKRRLAEMRKEEP